MSTDEARIPRERKCIPVLVVAEDEKAIPVEHGKAFRHAAHRKGEKIALFAQFTLEFYPLGNIAGHPRQSHDAPLAVSKGNFRGEQVPVTHAFKAIDERHTRPHYLLFASIQFFGIGRRSKIEIRKPDQIRRSAKAKKPDHVIVYDDEPAVLVLYIEVVG